MQLKLIFMCIQLSSTTLFGMPVPLPTDTLRAQHTRVRHSSASQGNAQDMEATVAKILSKECQGCSEARRPSGRDFDSESFDRIEHCHYRRGINCHAHMKPVAGTASMQLAQSRLELDQEYVRWTF